MSKTLTKADVFDVASDLIETNGSTTTLDIKNELRVRGFFAKQADVSDLMIQVCAEENYSFSYNGVHRVYTDSKGQSVAQPTTANQSTTQSLRAAAGQPSNANQIVPASVATGRSHTTRSGKVIVSFANANLVTTGSWKAYSVTSQTVYWFPSTYTRDDVRIAYRAFTGIHLHDVRACR
ncbi:MAG: hypothetical protein M0R51_10645, partial [Clostridia bacterium]|nr:hypothetical protein [Clostridia bacterium]